MARNDIVLLDSLIDKAREQLGADRAIGELFELFCLDQILKDYDLSYDEIEAGWVDGSDDAGIDAIFTFLDSKVVLDKDVVETAKRNPLVEVYAITTKHADSFQQSPLDKLISTLPVLFDLRNSLDRLPFPVNSDLTESLNLFRKTYIALADRHPKLVVNVVYACRGDTAHMPTNISQRGEYLERELAQLFSNAEVKMTYSGASELLQLARRTKVYSLRLKFIESYVSRESTNYVVLTLLPNYYKFVTDANGHLRRYLFESNVRDYLGGAINRDIHETLSLKCSPTELDFWWLNNGVTLLASSATIVGKEISLENVQIVNGLQTTETIYNHFVSIGNYDDGRALLVKIIITDNPEVRDKIIKATNYQNPVGLASLRATDKIQRDIEHYLADHGWFYDRRKGFHKNQGRPAEKIVSMSYLGSAVRAIALCDPTPAILRKTHWLKNEQSYRQVFKETYSLGVYLGCLEILKATEALLREGFPRFPLYRRARREMAPLVSLMYVTSKLRKRKFGPNEVASLEGTVPSRDEVIKLCQIIEAESPDQKRFHSPIRSKQFISSVLDRVLK